MPTKRHNALNEAKAIEPNNKEVSELMVQLTPLLPAPATKPVTVQATDRQFRQNSRHPRRQATGDAGGNQRHPAMRE